MYLELVDKFENELRNRGIQISPELHDARFDFALWLEKNAAQHGVERTVSQSSEAVPGVADEIEELWAGE